MKIEVEVPEIYKKFLDEYCQRTGITLRQLIKDLLERALFNFVYSEMTA